MNIQHVNAIIMSLYGHMSPEERKLRDLYSAEFQARGRRPL